MQDYFLQKTAPSTSCLYYSVRRMPQQQQQRIIMVHAFYRSILAVLFDCNEVDIARAQLQWWRDQVMRLKDHAVDHPILKALQDQIDIDQSQALMYEIINGIDSYLDNPLFMQESDLYHHFAKTAGARELIILKNDNSYDQAGLADFAYNLASSMELIHQIRNMYQYIQKGHFLFTQADLDHCQADLKDFHQWQPTSQVQQFIQMQADKARQYHQTAWQTPVTLTSPLQRYYSHYSRLYLKTLQVIENQNFEVLKQYIKLNPLNKLFKTLF